MEIPPGNDKSGRSTSDASFVIFHKASHERIAFRQLFADLAIKIHLSAVVTQGSVITPFEIWIN